MLKKYGKFYADWHDEHGKRHRKAFPTRKAALHFQTKQRNLVAAKKARPTRAARRFSKPGHANSRAIRTFSKSHAASAAK